jgi:hypothetical protein
MPLPKVTGNSSTGHRPCIQIPDGDKPPHPPDSFSGVDGVGPSGGENEAIVTSPVKSLRVPAFAFFF